MITLYLTLSIFFKIKNTSLACVFKIRLIKLSCKILIQNRKKKKTESNDSSAPIKRYKKFSNLLLNSFTTRPTRNYSRTTVLTFKVIAVPTCAKFRLLPPFNILDLISSVFFAAMVQDVFEKIYKKYSKTCTCVQMVRISYCNVNKKKVKLVKLV